MTPAAAMSSRYLWRSVTTTTTATFNPVKSLVAVRPLSTPAAAAALATTHPFDARQQGSAATTAAASAAMSRLMAAVGLLGGAVALNYSNNSSKKTDCCGIVGVVGTAEHTDAREFLLDGLTILKNRGYDSAGIATVPHNGGEMHVTKFASDGDKADSIELVKKHSHPLGHTLGIAHTRW